MIGMIVLYSSQRRWLLVDASSCLPYSQHGNCSGLIALVNVVRGSNTHHKRQIGSIGCIPVPGVVLSQLSSTVKSLLFSCYAVTLSGSCVAVQRLVWKLIESSAFVGPVIEMQDTMSALLLLLLSFRSWLVLVVVRW